MSSDDFPKLLCLKLWEKSVEDLVDYTMLILEVVERPLHFVIEVEVGGKCQLSRDDQVFMKACIILLAIYFIIWDVQQGYVVENVLCWKSILNIFNYVKVKLTLEEGLHGFCSSAEY